MENNYTDSTSFHVSSVETLIAIHKIMVKDKYQTLNFDVGRNSKQISDGKSLKGIMAVSAPEMFVKVLGDDEELIAEFLLEFDATIKNYQDTNDILNE